MCKFLLITEGVTDQITLRHILSKYYVDKNINVTNLQPVTDATDDSKQKGKGGWERVLGYLRSDEFKESFDFADYFIIQIDTDVSCEFNFDVPHRDKNTGCDLTQEELFQRVKDKLISCMDEEFYKDNKDKIIFAICIHSLECWFLPFYCDNERKRDIKNCLYKLFDELNRKVSKKIKFKSCRDHKIPAEYREIAKVIKKKKEMIELSKHNRSLQMFLDSLPKK